MAGFVRKIEKMNISTSLKSEFSLETRLDAFDGSIRQAKGGNSIKVPSHYQHCHVRRRWRWSESRGRKMETGNQSGNRAHGGYLLLPITCFYPILNLYSESVFERVKFERDKWRCGHDIEDEFKYIFLCDDNIHNCVNCILSIRW